MRNDLYRKVIQTTVDWTDYKEFNCQLRNGVYFHTNVVWVREYPSGETIVVSRPDYQSLVAPRPSF